MFEANEANMRRSRKGRAIHPAYNGATTPHPMHMHTVAPNRLQDDLCNLWRLHTSHRQHTHTHRPQASKQPLPISMMPRNEQAVTPLRNHCSQINLACQSSRRF